MRVSRTIVASVLLTAAAACQPEAMQERHRAALTLSAESLTMRQAQIRRFDTKDELSILAASAGVLQDLGFLIEESAAAAGLIVGSKNRDAVETAQVTGQLVLAALIIALGGRADPVWERDQRIRISVATRPAPRDAGMIVRVTFQRVIWNTKNQISRVESIEDPEIYREFFDKLAQSVFLEAHEI